MRFGCSFDVGLPYVVPSVIVRKTAAIHFVHLSIARCVGEFDMRTKSITS